MVRKLNEDRDMYFNDSLDDLYEITYNDRMLSDKYSAYQFYGDIGRYFADFSEEENREAKEYVNDLIEELKDYDALSDYPYKNKYLVLYEGVLSDEIVSDEGELMYADYAEYVDVLFEDFLSHVNCGAGLEAFDLTPRDDVYKYGTYVRLGIVNSFYDALDYLNLVTQFENWLKEVAVAFQDEAWTNYEEDDEDYEFESVRKTKEKKC